MGSCIHFPDDENANCSMCKSKPKVDSWDVVADRGIVEAQYAGTCGACGASIYENDLIRNGRHGWQHIDCTARS